MLQSHGSESGSNQVDGEQLEKAMQEIRNLQEQLSKEREHVAQYKVNSSAARFK